VTDNLPTAPSASNNLELLAQAHEGEAFALLVEMIRDKDIKPDQRIRAAERILDQARGRPKVAMPKDPTARKQKALSMSVDTLMAIVKGAAARTEQADRTRVQARILEGEFTPAPRKRPVNEYAVTPPTPAPTPVVPGTKDVDDLLT
jgi:hypothetical protein